LQERKVQVLNRLGLHARPAALLVSTATKFSSEILALKDRIEVHCKSIMGVMMLAAEKGSWLTLRAVGEDENQAIETLSKLFVERFGEQ